MLPRAGGAWLPRHCGISAAPSSTASVSVPGQAGCAVRRAAPRDGALAAGEEAGLELLGRAGVVPVHAADLARPPGPRPGNAGRTPLTPPGAGDHLSREAGPLY